MDIRLVKYPNSILTTKSKAVKGPFSSYKDIINQMFDIMYRASGIGLAANQVGLDLQLFIMDVPEHRKESENAEADNEHEEPEKKDEPRAPENPIVCINPKIILAAEKVTSTEGCLSIPNLQVEIERYDYIEVEFFNADGEMINKKLHGLEAICFQHENDHINGKLMWDRLPAIERTITKKKYKKSLELENEN